jgi:RimJ/RimL family protein N-acetyltransferase
MAEVALRPFTRDELALVDPWFADPDTQRWLGGPAWPAQMLALAAAPLGAFRGALEAGRYRWLAWDGDRPVGYIDGGTYDRWTTWDPDRGVVACLPGPAAAITYVVDPSCRRRGYATAMITALLDVGRLSDVVVFGAGVAPDNVASAGCLLACGFRPLDARPDWEGVVYYVLHRADH